MSTLKKKPLLEKILEKMKEEGGNIPLSKIYDAFQDEKKSTIRGRINEAVAANKHIIRTSKGHYMLLGAEVEAIVEHNDTKSALFEIIKANIYYDLIFLDIPYLGNGQKGGNRNISNYNLIDPEEFAEILVQAEKMLKTEDSQMYFMITSGKSSQTQVNNYIRAFDETALSKAAEGSYTKLTSQGKVCNIGKYLIPPEKIYVFSPNGKLLKPEETVLDFRLQRPPLPKSGGYPTQKPLEMYKQIFKQGTKEGGRILDPFAGSFESLRAALENGNKYHGIDISTEAIENHARKRLEMFGRYYNAIQEERKTYYQSNLFDYLDNVENDFTNNLEKDISSTLANEAQDILKNNQNNLIYQ